MHEANLSAGFRGVRRSEQSDWEKEGQPELAALLRQATLPPLPALGE
jgi:hypothetical protein